MDKYHILKLGGYKTTQKIELKLNNKKFLDLLLYFLSFLNYCMKINFDQLKEMKIIDKILSETLVKKYILIQLPTQFNLVRYACGSSTLKVGPAPALDHNSYHDCIWST